MTQGTGLAPERSTAEGDADAGRTDSGSGAGQEPGPAAEREAVDEQIDRMVRTVDSMLERIEQLED